jgi:hypothetical protein
MGNFFTTCIIVADPIKSEDRIAHLYYMLSSKEFEFIGMAQDIQRKQSAAPTMGCVKEEQLNEEGEHENALVTSFDKMYLDKIQSILYVIHRLLSKIKAMQILRVTNEQVIMNMEDEVEEALEDIQKNMLSNFISTKKTILTEFVLDAVFV